MVQVSQSIKSYFSIFFHVFPRFFYKSDSSQKSIRKAKKDPVPRPMWIHARRANRAKGHWQSGEKWDEIWTEKYLRMILDVGRIYKLEQ